MSINDWYLPFLKNLLPRMEALENSLSIVIQGPLHERIKESIPIYLDLIKSRQHFSQKLENNPYSQDKTLGNLVISCWENDDLNLIKDYQNHNDIQVVVNKYSDLPVYEKKIGARGAAPWIYQNYTTLAGLNECTGNLSIKVRSDEIYKNLEPFASGISSNCRKILTSDIFFRKDREEKFHISDHIIGGTTCSMKGGFRKAVYMCAQKYPEGVKFPEQLICQSFLKYLGEDVTKVHKSKKMMKDNFIIIPISRLGDITWTCSYRRYAPLKSQETGWVQNINSI